MQADSNNSIQELTTEHPKFIPMFYFIGTWIQPHSLKQIFWRNIFSWLLDAGWKRMVEATISQLSNIQIKIVKKATHHRAFEDQGWGPAKNPTLVFNMTGWAIEFMLHHWSVSVWPIVFINHRDKPCVVMLKTTDGDLTPQSWWALIEPDRINPKQMALNRVSQIT